MTEPITSNISDHICQHMNEDHSDAVILYAKVFGQSLDVTHAEMLSIDALGMNLKVEPSVNNQPMRIQFDHSLKDAHYTLIDMIKLARQSLRSNSSL